MKKYLAAGIACALICVILAVLLLSPRPAPKQTVEDIPQVLEVYEQARSTDAPPKSSVEMKAPPAAAPEEVPEAEIEPYVSPIDFAALQEQTPDIYAWLDIPGTEVSFPVVQNEDDTYYLTHDIYGNNSASGAIFTESAYNSKSFDEPITAVYGHRMYSGEMFGALQILYSSQQALADYSQITVYLPEKELHYQVFAAVPYDNRHIPYNYGDGTARSMRSFLYSVSSVKSIDAYLDTDAFAASDDRIIVLSTCLYGDRNQRFLVVAKQVDPVS